VETKKIRHRFVVIARMKKRCVNCRTCVCCDCVECVVQCRGGKQLCSNCEHVQCEYCHSRNLACSAANLLIAQNARQHTVMSPVSFVEISTVDHVEVEQCVVPAGTRSS
jgi:hypothetical protein